MSQFLKDVYEGLESEPKTLSSKYFYDEIGDDLFVKIMNMPEYYLTNCEFEIFSEQSSSIISAFNMTEEFDLIELGAGDGTKTIELLKALNGSVEYVYSPVDISENALEGLKKRLNDELPSVKVDKQQGEYFEVLGQIKDVQKPKVILFLGSNIGNLEDANAKKFISLLAQSLNAGDKLLIGIDLIKSSSIVLPAYNDGQGYTRDFNLNLLNRINQELKGNIEVDNFKHVPSYTSDEGIARSHIESLCDQTFTVSGKQFSLTKGEQIRTEISRKYNDQIMADIINGSGLKVINKFTDKKNYFADYLLEKG
ncbi:MAG: L-histidine N-alpha-methyltransferase [Parvicellaceae bacterium]|jgi:L-histidine N-alpha-methyltransferase